MAASQLALLQRTTKKKVSRSWCVIMETWLTPGWRLPGHYGKVLPGPSAWFTEASEYDRDGPPPPVRLERG